MITNIYKTFREGTLTEKIIINVTLTELGAGLYPYMYMLRQTNNATESVLVEALRSEIFDARDKYSEDEITKLHLAAILTKVRDLLNVQLVMLRANSERKWEAGFFTSYMNDLTDFMYLMNPNKSKE